MTERFERLVRQRGAQGSVPRGAKVSEPSADGAPDFASMTPAQKIAYHKARWDRILG